MASVSRKDVTLSALCFLYFLLVKAALFTLGVYPSVAGAQVGVDYQCNKTYIPANCHTDGRYLNGNGTRYFMFVTHTSCTWADARYFCNTCGGNLAVLKSGDIDADLDQWATIMYRQRDGQQIEAWLGYKYDNLGQRFVQVDGLNRFQRVGDASGSGSEAQDVVAAIDRKCRLSSLDDSEADGDPRRENNCRYDLEETYLHVRRQLASGDMMHFFGDRREYAITKHFLCEIPVVPASTTEYKGLKYTLFDGALRYYRINSQGVLEILGLVPPDQISTEPSVEESRDDFRFLHITIPSLCAILVLFVIIFLICKVQRPHDF